MKNSNVLTLLHSIKPSHKIFGQVRSQTIFFGQDPVCDIA